jgi:hypothetical protein
VGTVDWPQDEQAITQGAGTGVHGCFAPKLVNSFRINMMDSSMRKDDWSIFWKPHAALTVVAVCTLLPFWLGWLPLRWLDGLAVLNIKNCPPPVPNGVNGLSRLFSEISLLLTAVIGLTGLFELGPSIYRFRSKASFGSMFLAALITTAMSALFISGIVADSVRCDRAAATLRVFIGLFLGGAITAHFSVLACAFSWLQVAGKSGLPPDSKS